MLALNGALADMIDAGARIVGGCCGTTPEYIKAVADAVKDIKPKPAVKKNICTVSSYTHAVDFGNVPVLIGERINPTGKKLLKEALREKNFDYILSEALGQTERGAHVLDVNVGLPDIDEATILEKTVKEIKNSKRNLKQ